MRFNIGDIVRVKGSVGIVDFIDLENEPRYRVSINGQEWWFSEDIMEPYAEKTYEQGLADAWELARRVIGHPSAGGYTMQELEDVFGIPCPASLLSELTIEEALAKLDEFERQQSLAPNMIVEDKEGIRALILDECGDDTFSVLTENGCVERWDREMCFSIREKTIDVSNLVQQIRE